MAHSPHKKINVNLLIPFVIVALVFGFTIWQKYRSSRELPAQPQVQQSVGKRTAVLFFVEDGTRLVREARELERCDGEAETCIKELLQELLNGPLGGFDKSLPEGTVINTVRINGELADIDLNQTFADSMPSGSSAEMMAVYSIVNTVAANFQQITKVKLTIEGDDKSLLSHLDLSDPLVPDYTLELPPAPASTKPGLPSSPKK